MKNSQNAPPPALTPSFRMPESCFLLVTQTNSLNLGVPEKSASNPARYSYGPSRLTDDCLKVFRKEGYFSEITTLKAFINNANYKYTLNYNCTQKITQVVELTMRAN